MPNTVQWESARARAKMNAALRAFFDAKGFLEVETPALVPSPGMEPHIQAFEAAFVPERGMPGRPRTLYLHTSPEYAMKRLLADGSGPVFQLARVFRNGEVSATHNPEFTMLEFYRPQADYRTIMNDVEQALAAVDKALRGDGFFSQLPFARVTVREAVRAASGIDLERCEDAATLAREARACGVRLGESEAFDDVFFHLFLQKVESGLGMQRPTFLIDYPVALAALARAKPDNPRVAERFELYGRGVELANGFSELTDAAEQRRRLQDEQAQRCSLGHAVYELDEAFLAALGRMPPSGGVAVGLDRVLMGILGLENIEQALLFPAHGFLA